MVWRDARVGGMMPARMIFYGATGFFALWLLVAPCSPAQAALLGFVAGTAVWLRLTMRGDPIGHLQIQRTHRVRVFESDPLSIVLRVRRGEGWPLQLLELEDTFNAALNTRERHLIPLLTPGWEVLLHYERFIDRHRGLYLIGPVRVRVGDGLGVFFQDEEVEPITRLTVYPHSEPLPGYSIPGPQAAEGPSLDAKPHIGQGEEVLSVREYRAGDPPHRIHWRTSARRGRLHVMQLNRPVQAELAIMLDMTRAARFGLGGEATTEQAICAAASLLSRAFEARHRFSLTYVQNEAVHFPAGTGLAHLQLLLDRLAIIQPEGDASFWAMCAPRALLLKPGSRAVFIAAGQRAPIDPVCSLIRQLGQRWVGVDLVLIDEADYIKIWHDQEVDRRSQPSFSALVDVFAQSGARVYPLSRHKPHLGETVAHRGESIVR